ncbi:uncharacterized protein sS8_2495 [Methylocaldum marinum]|uniref:Uncharacterized protein n=1 Tax=Methylocaldum marinum TaxID=1432792 RepID=A0A250KS65_9GAMM|nr:hypothetical protein [Methylocaldum marinum]BBA34447.1 uncharacterized protein sS8_2495 [Methylocaldum marinum]
MLRPNYSFKPNPPASRVGLILVLAIIELSVQKINLKKDLKHLYQPSAKEVVCVDVPTLQFLMIDGEGDPNTSQEYAQAVEALFSVSYTVKFMIKKRPQAVDYGVMVKFCVWGVDQAATFSTSS